MHYSKQSPLKDKILLLFSFFPIIHSSLFSPQRSTIQETPERCPGISPYLLFPISPSSFELPCLSAHKANASAGRQLPALLSIAPTILSSSFLPHTSFIIRIPVIPDSASNHSGLSTYPPSYSFDNSFSCFRASINLFSKSSGLFNTLN